MEARMFTSDKILNHPERIYEWMQGKNPFAIMMEIDPTNKCGHKCPGCTGWYGTDRSSLSLDEMKDAVDQCKEMGIKSINLVGGGEPLQNPATEEMIPYIANKGIEVALTTNGSLLHQIDMVEALKHLTWTKISLDAGSPEVYKKTHGLGERQFNQVVDNLRELVKIKREIGSKTTIGVGYLTGRGTANLDDMSSFVQMSISLGVDYAQFRPYIYGLSNSDKTNLASFAPIHWESFENESTEQTSIVCSKHKYECMLRPKEQRRTYGKCYGVYFQTSLLATGDFTLCCHTKGLPQFSFGNIKKNSVRHIWNSDERRKAIASVVLKDCPLFCRCNTFNEVLWDIKQRKEHINFI